MSVLARINLRSVFLHEENVYCIILRRVSHMTILILSYNSSLKMRGFSLALTLCQLQFYYESYDRYICIIHTSSVTNSIFDCLCDGVFTVESTICVQFMH